MKKMLAKQKIKRYMGFVSLVSVFLLILSTEARAEIYGFEAITNNSSDAWIGESQLSVEVTPEGTDQVLFTFRNSGPEDSTIHEVYFEDGSLLQIYDDPLTTGIDSVEGIRNDIYNVYFQIGANPDNLPAYNNVSPPFNATEAFSVDNTTQNSYGVDPGEELGVLFDLVEGKFFADVITAINLGFTNPDTGPIPKDSLRIGLHVGNIGEDEDNDSESYIMTPIPSAVLLGMLGLGIAGLKLRKYA